MWEKRNEEKKLSRSMTVLFRRWENMQNIQILNIVRKTAEYGIYPIYAQISSSVNLVDVTMMYK